MILESDVYPTQKEISDIKTNESLLPKSNLIKRIKRRLKRSSVWQVIISTANPKSPVLPITFGIGVKMDNLFGSGWLIDELSKLGFFCFLCRN